MMTEAGHYSVLVVEDNQDIVIGVQDLLRHDGYTVDVAGTCARAIELARARRYNAVLLDLTLPDGDGLDVLKTIHDLDSTLPVVIVTASTSTEKTVGSLTRGAFAYITKPYHREELRQTLRRAVGLKELTVKVAQAEGLLSESEERFRSLVESATDAIVVADGRGTILSWNRTASNLFGYTNEEVVGRPLTLLMPERYRIPHERGLARMEATGESHVIGSVVELHGLKKDGTEFPIELSLATWKTGERRFYSGIIRDNSERKRAETSLRQLNHRYSLILNQAGEGIYGLDLQGRTTFVNPAAANMLGWTMTELVGQPMHSTLHHSYADGRPYPAEGCPIYAAFRDGCTHRMSDEVFWRKDGTSFPVEYISTPIREDGELAGAVIVFKDITERKKAEDALRESEERFRQVTEHIREVFWTTDPSKDQMVYISPTYEEIWGRSCESLYTSPLSWIEAIHPEDRDQVRAAALSKQNSGEYDERYRIIRPDGSVRWVWDRAFPIRDASGQVYRITGIAEDITEQKVAENLLLQSRNRLQAILNYTGAVIYLKDLDGRYLLVNRRWETVLGKTADHVIGKTPRDIFPKTVAEEFLAHDRQVLEADGPVQFEEQFPHHDGIHTYLSLRFPLRDQSGAPYGVCGISTDISERKRSEESLRLSEERLDLAMHGSNDGFWDGQVLPNEPWHSPRTPVWWSARVREMLGYSTEEFPDVIESWTSRLHPDDRARVYAALEAHMDRREPYDVEYRLLTSGEQYEWFRARGQASWDESGKLRRMAGSLQRISDRKQAEEALRRSEQLLNDIVNHTTAVIYVKYSDGRYLLANRRFEALFNLTQNQIVGRTDHELFPREIADVFRANDLRVLERNAPEEYEEQAPHSDGLHTYLSIKFPLRDETGAPYALCGISSDITHHKQAEDRLRVGDESATVDRPASQLGVWNWDIQADRLYWSPQASALFGMAGSPGSGDQQDLLMRIYQEDRTTTRLAFKQAVKQPNKPMMFSHRVVWPDGTHHWLVWAGHLVCDRTGAPVNALGTVRESIPPHR